MRQWAVRARGIVLLIGMVGLASFLEACASIISPSSESQEEASSALQDDETRMVSIGLPLFVATADWCPHSRGLLYGFVLEDGTPPFVRYVHPNLPAGRAGLRAGMQILAVNETPVTGVTATHMMQLINRASRSKIQPLELFVQDGSPRTLAFDGVAACRHHLKLVKDDVINASADGTTISVTTGMVTFVKTDAELAFVIAHEIAHNVLDHPDAARVQVLMDTFHTTVTGERRGAMAWDKAKHREVDADYIGLYILAKAGYDVRSVGDLWRRIESLSRRQSIVNFAEIHPSTSERLALFQRTVHEIESKRREGMSLHPKGLDSNPSIGSETER